MCAGKCSFFVSEFQLVNVYSDRKLVTPLSNYMGLESAEHVGICLEEELQTPFQTCRARDARALRGAATSGALQRHQNRGSTPEPPPALPPHTAFVWGSSSGFCQKMGDQAGTALPLEAGVWLLESTLSAGQGVRLLTCPCCNTRTNDHVTLHSKGTLQM